MERESDPEKDRRNRSGQASTSRPLGEQRCCIGLTYFSQALHEQGKMPVRSHVACKALSSAATLAG